MISLVKATTGGADWEVFYDSVGITGQQNSALFIFFIAFYQISLLNVLTGIFVENAMKLAQPDPYTAALEHRKQERQEADQLRSVCKHLDKSGNGHVSFEEFEEAIHRGKLRAHLRVLGLDIKDSRKFFELIKCASGNEVVAIGKSEVDMESFVMGCMKLKGTATSLDLQSLLAETHRGNLQQHQHILFVRQKLGKAAQILDKCSDIPRYNSNVSSAASPAFPPIPHSRLISPATSPLPESHVKVRNGSKDCAEILLDPDQRQFQL
jgi:hypothetical protein